MVGPWPESAPVGHYKIAYLRPIDFPIVVGPSPSHQCISSRKKGSIHFPEHVDIGGSHGLLVSRVWRYSCWQGPRATQVAAALPSYHNIRRYADNNSRLHDIPYETNYISAEFVG